MADSPPLSLLIVILATALTIFAVGIASLLEQSRPRALQRQAHQHSRQAVRRLLR